MKLNISDELAKDIWNDWVVGCFKNKTIEEAVREWLELYKDVNPRLLGNAAKRKAVFEVLEQSNVLQRIEELYSMYKVYEGFSNKMFAASLEGLLAAVELAIAKEITSKNR